MINTPPIVEAEMPFPVIASAQHGFTRFGFLCLLLLFPILVATTAWAQYSESTLLTFTGGSGGGVPAGLISDSKGNLYGATWAGGNLADCTEGTPTGCGVLYELSPPSSGFGPWTQTVLYTFTGNPVTSLIFDSQGNLYGTSFGGGAYNAGMVVELSPPSSGAGSWTETTLYSFTGGSDGLNPALGLAFDSRGNLYGTTGSGGNTSACPGNIDMVPGCGVVFELSPPSSGGGPWTEAVLYAFMDGSDGGFPGGGLIFDTPGNLYGVTCCAVFELSPASTGSGPWTETVLHNFTDDNGLDGPVGLIFGSAGNLYGPLGGDGGVFELSPPSGGSGPWTETLLYTFPGADYSPNGGLVFDSGGNLYGSTAYGGISTCFEFGCGLVYELSPPSGGSGPWTENVLYSFTGGSDGSMPERGLIRDSQGDLFGVAGTGGNASDCAGPGCGVVFELTPQLQLTPSTSSVSIVAGQSGTAQLTVNTTSGAPAAEAILTCKVVPADATCSLSPSSVTAYPAIVTLTISTSTVNAGLQKSCRPAWPLFGMLLPGLLLLPARSRNRRRGILWLVSGLVLVLSLSFIGCGSSSSSSASSQSYKVTITASSAGSVSAMTTISVAVTQ